MACYTLKVFSSIIVIQVLFLFIFRAERVIDQ
jgi:hypothetical protein